MKRIIALLLCLLTLAAAACAAPLADKKNGETTAGTSAQSAETPSELPSDTDEGSSASESSKQTSPEIDEHAKKMYNTATKTEDDLDVIHLGLYEFVLADGRKLGYLNDEVVVADGSNNAQTQFLVSFQNSGKDSTGRAGVRYVLYAGDTVKKSLYGSYGSSLYIDEANDRYTNTNWNIEEKKDGTVMLKCVSNSRYIGIDAQDGVSLTDKGEPDYKQSFKMNLISEGSTCFVQTISEKGNIVLRTSPKLEKRSKLKADRRAKLANDLQLAYETYYELTDYLVWESIIIRVYQTEPYFGYIYPSWNVISFNLDSALGDLEKMVLRDTIDINDWNFCLLHEMGHMFDAYRGWKFHGEFATNMKVAYVLYKNSDLGASAATAGWGYKDCFNGEHIKDMWNTCPKMTASTGFNLDRLLYIFVTYAEKIGWENVKKAYHEIQHMEYQETNPVNCFWLFTDTMQKYAPDNLHVKDTMQKGELEIVLKEIGG